MARLAGNKITGKQRKFAELYAKTGSVPESARGAGYSETYTLKLANELLDLPLVQDEIKRLRLRLNEVAEKSAVDVINEYAVIAFNDRVEFLKPDPDYVGQLCYKSPFELTTDQRKCIEKVHVNKRFGEPDAQGQINFIREEYSYTFIPKETALNQMGRHFGIFDDKLRISTGTNQFKNLPTDKLIELKQAFASIMANESNIIEGKFIERKSK